MREASFDRGKLRALLSEPEADVELADFLVANSKLPGPRANLALAATFADQLGASGADDARWRLLQHWLEISAADAPAGNPREFLPFCAVQTLGALYAGAGTERRREIVALLQVAADDERWRVREGVAIALQRIARHNSQDLMSIIDAWLPRASFTGQRAIVAALAEPPLLRNTGLARYALAVADQIIANVREQDPAARKTEAFRILRQGLEYALSVIVAALPSEGLARLRAWAASDDADLKRIVRANLQKARLANSHPAEVERVARVMG